MDRIRERWRTLAMCALLGAVTLAAYWPVLHNSFIHYDDADYVTENAPVRTGLSWENVVWAFGSGHSCNWHPVTWISHMLDCQLYGLNATGHHLTNLLFHIANTVLLFLLLKRMTGATWRSGFVAGLFALHPLHVESVAWVAERKDVLSGFFFMLTLLAYAKYVSGVGCRVSGVGERAAGKGHPKPEARTAKNARNTENSATDNTDGADQDSSSANSVASTPAALQTTESGDRAFSRRSSILHPPSSFFYALSLALFALGLMSKPMLVTLPFVLLLLDYWPLRRLEIRARGDARPPVAFWRLVFEKVPFLGLAAGSCVVTYLVQASGHATSLGLPLGPRVANAIASYLKYLGKAVWPSDLSIFYLHPDIRYPISHQWPGGLILLAAAALAAVSVIAVIRLKRWPWLATGWFWYLGTLVPVIGIAQVGGQAMADRYSYLPLIGFFICLAWGADALISRRRFGRPILGTGALAAIALCAVITRTQAGYWRNNLTLFEHALAVDPKDPVAHYNVGCDLERAGRHELALAHFRTALAADPTYADAYCAMAISLNALGSVEEATEACRTTLRLRPWLAQSHTTLAIMLWLQGKRQEAVEEYTEALRLNPDCAEAEYGLGLILLEDNKYAEAAKRFSAAIRQKPDEAEPRAALGRALAMQGKFTEAEAPFREALRLCPTNADAHVELGNTLMETGRTNEAAGCFASALRLEPALADRSLQEGRVMLEHGQMLMALSRFSVAARLKPNNAEAHESLGLLYARSGKLDQAVSEFEQTLRLRPDAQAHYNLGLARVMQGKLPEAVSSYEQAVKLKLDWVDALNDLAWIRATAPQAELRDGAEAVRLAERARDLSGGKEARLWGTLDAAYAEAGRFGDAISAAEKARELALAGVQTEVASAAERRLALYRKQEAYHQPGLKSAP